LLYIERYMATGSERKKANDLFTALGHPLRRQILRKMLEEDSEMTPLELSVYLGEPLSALSYHVRVLAECGAVKLARTRQVRGSTQHFYSPAIDTPWARSALDSTEDPPHRGGPRGEEKA
jgi:DNA-binding transcriptional ArsR family regulator